VTPSQILSRFAEIFEGADYPAMDEISGPIIWPHSWVTPSQVLSRFAEILRGADYPAMDEISGPIIRPHIWVTPAEVLSRFLRTENLHQFNTHFNS
jgi:hypothetical protein